MEASRKKVITQMPSRLYHPIFIHTFMFLDIRYRLFSTIVKTKVLNCYCDKTSSEYEMNMANNGGDLSKCQ
ncbi:hypothetical protein M378DRAFT_163633 [Amanita muscaria Koide BX008]|uniref:Uncharacterized protein n=1 Tax=Amanita muscaria (strain Koide BX008) TaxID=946122 RepID=A0A0C2X4F4_AMAMK|nr:hypothetical protein M378DRAFT_163633 [Amanita muscaria Koide BX008]